MAKDMANVKKYPIPYRSILAEKIEPGQTLIVQGKTFESAERFSINFHKDSADFSGVDIPLHLSIRFDEGKLGCKIATTKERAAIVLNSLAAGEWGKEERKSIPFKKGAAFDIRIRAHDDRFVIFCDHKEFKEFEYRLPLTYITHMSIDGDLDLANVHWGGKYY
uniref:Galectin n=1 Tax=Plectus sambesii TaxID=2011161 RepID=A0A914X7U3_9BILA